MNYKEKALKIATKAHEGQFDKGGKPYIEHPLKVASVFDDYERYITAILHDVIEDTDITIDDLKLEGFDESILIAIEILTKTNKGYDKYIELIKTNPIARDVKIEDLKHNMDLNRLPVVNDYDLKRAKKYLKALKYLQN